MGLEWLYAMVINGLRWGGVLRCLFSFFLRSSWAFRQLRSEKETRNKLIEADMNGKPQSGLFTKYVSFLFGGKQLHGEHRETSFTCCHQLLSKFSVLNWISSFLFNLSSRRYNLSCFSTNPQSRSLVPWLLLLLSISLSFGLRVAPSHRAEQPSLWVLFHWENRDRVFAGWETLANLGNARPALESVANAQCWDVGSADGFSPCSICSKSCLRVPENSEITRLPGGS